MDTAELWLVRCVVENKTYSTQKHPDVFFNHQVFMEKYPYKRLHLASAQDLADRQNSLYAKIGSTWYSLHEDPNVKNVTPKAVEDGICSYCGQPENSTTCQRSHP